VPVQLPCENAPLFNAQIMSFPSPTARPAVQALRASKIREVANAGMDRADVIAFWFGEPDEVTPEFIRRPESKP
jgi:hypothetical protein